MTRIVVDPVTRIEGHLRVEAEGGLHVDFRVGRQRRIEALGFTGHVYKSGYDSRGLSRE